MTYIPLLKILQKKSLGSISPQMTDKLTQADCPTEKNQKTGQD